MENLSQKALAQQLFGKSAQEYVSSKGHAQGNDLQHMIELAKPEAHERMLDIATGGGHTALAFAPFVSEVVASDITSEMLAAAQKFIESKGINNVRFEHADAEDLPFADASFDLVSSRIAPHHFPNPQQFVNEVARVLKPGGRFILNDNMAPERFELDAFLNRFEQWRDPSHVWAAPRSEWIKRIEKSGLTVSHAEPLLRKSHEFQPWIGRLGTPITIQQQIEEWMINAPELYREVFGIVVEEGRITTIDGLYSIIVATKPE
jgi:ubiquinone/menaquinone biosynthesis C-methylase UbiE